MESFNFNALRISLRDLLFIIFTKLHVLIGTLIVIVSYSTVNIMTIKPQYRVSATILLKPFVDSRYQLEVNRFSVQAITKEDINTEIKIMTSKELLRRTVLKLGMVKPKKNGGKIRLMVKLGISFDPDPVDAAINRFRGGLSISSVTASNMIRITMKGFKPSRITESLNTFIDLYIDRHIEVHKSVGGVDFYTHQANLMSQKLIESETKVKDFQKKWNLINVEQQNSHNVRLIQLIRESLAKLRGQIAQKKMTISQISENVGNIWADTPLVDIFRNSSIIVNLTKALVPMMVEKERIAMLYPEDSIEYQDLKLQVDQFQKAIVEEQKRIIDGINIDLKSLISREQALEQEIENIREESGILMEKQLKGGNLIRKMQQNKKNYMLYLKKIDEARMSEQRDSFRVANIVINNRPEEPSVPFYPKKKKMITLSIILGFIAGIGTSFAAYFMDHTVKHPEDLELHCQIQVLSTLKKVRY